MPVRLSSHSLERRAIQSHASETELNRPISSIVPSAHSTSTYQNTLSAVVISRGLKMGLPESGKPAFTLVALLLPVKFLQSRIRGGGGRGRLATLRSENAVWSGGGPPSGPGDPLGQRKGARARPERDTTEPIEAANLYQGLGAAPGDGHGAEALGLCGRPLSGSGRPQQGAYSVAREDGRQRPYASSTGYGRPRRRDCFNKASPRSARRGPCRARRRRGGRR